MHYLYLKKLNFYKIKTKKSSTTYFIHTLLLLFPRLVLIIIIIQKKTRKKNQQHFNTIYYMSVFSFSVAYIKILKL